MSFHLKNVDGMLRHLVGNYVDQSKMRLTMAYRLLGIEKGALSYEEIIKLCRETDETVSTLSIGDPAIEYFTSLQEQYHNLLHCTAVLADDSSDKEFCLVIKNSNQVAMLEQVCNAYKCVYTHLVKSGVVVGIVIDLSGVSHTAEHLEEMFQMIAMETLTHSTYILAPQEYYFGD